MDKQVKWGILAVCFCTCAFLIAGTFFVLEGRSILVAGKSSDDLKMFHDILVQVHKPCKGSGADKADNCGTISLANQDMVDTGDLIKLSQKNELRETDLFNKTLPPLLASVKGTVTSFGDTATALKGTANAATGTLDATTGTVAAAQPLLKNASALVANIDTETKPVIAHADLFLTHADAIASNPNIPKLFDNTQTITANFGSMTTDANLKFHALLFPPPCVGWKCHIGETINDIRIGSQFIEPAYYFRELLTGDQINGTINVVPAKQTSK
jgi:hypothetical protein